jgi:glycosyltransferase involved in cell wall biosynthesis
MPGKLKARLPIRLKRIPWYLFKAPQRREGTLKSLLTETVGLLSLGGHRLSRLFSPELKPISICTGLKNRTANYLDFVLTSISAMKNPELIELSIFDCGSEDAEYLEREIRRRWKGKLVFTKEETDFTRAYSFNRAIAQSSNQLIFATDADMSLPPDLVKQCNSYVSWESVWFPVCFYLYENRPAIIAPENGEWFPVGKGMFAATKAQFEQAGCYDTKYKSWGSEDVDLWLRFFKAGILPLRTRCKGLFHHYHPSLKPADFKPEF